MKMISYPLVGWGWEEHQCWGESKRGFYLPDLEIARSAWRPHNEQWAQIIAPQPLQVQLPHHPPQPGFRQTSDLRALRSQVG